MHLLRISFLAGLVALAPACSTDDAAARTLSIAAASDLRPVLHEIVDELESELDADVNIVYGSSGQLRQQISNGAPFDVFLSANSSYVDDLIDAGDADAATRSVFAMGALAIVTDTDALPNDLRALAADTYRRIAIANPAHAPYGVAAREALDRSDVLDTVENRLVLGESVADAYAIVTSGNADAAIVARSLALADDRPHVVVAASLHAPILQTAVVTTMAGNVDLATAVVEFLRSLDAQRVFDRFGFSPAVNQS